MSARQLRGKPLLITVGLVVIGLVAGWWGAYGVEEWLIQRAAGSPGLALAVRVRVVSPPEYGVTVEALEEVIQRVIRSRAPWVTLKNPARNRVELNVELKPMEDHPGGYHGWVRASFHRSRWVPGLVRRPPDWSDRILVLGAPPRLGSSPRDNVRGAVRILSETLVTQALSPR